VIDSQFSTIDARSSCSKSISSGFTRWEVESAINPQLNNIGRGVDWLRTQANGHVTLTG
jgi:hypothetical protein